MFSFGCKKLLYLGLRTCWFGAYGVIELLIITKVNTKKNRNLDIYKVYNIESHFIAIIGYLTFIAPILY